MDRYALLYNWLPPEGPFLDVGCGNGIFTQWLARKGKPVFGVDHHQGNLQWARREFPDAGFCSANGEHLPFPDNFFNAVMCTEVLEHVRDDKSTLAEICRVTRPRGTLLLSTPHRGLFTFLDPDNCINRGFDLLRRLHIPKPGGGRFYQHFSYDIHRHYSAVQLRSLLGDNWEIEEVYYGGLLLYPMCYGIENLIDAFSKRRSYWMRLKMLRTLRSWDFALQCGRLSYNIALKCRKVKS